MARSVVRATLVPALCLATALVQTAPLGLHLTTCIPFGNYPVPTVPRFNLWTLWWNSDRLLHGYRGYWQAPIFYPAPHSFACSEPLWLTGLVASPFWWISGSPALAYNAVLLLTFALNGWCGYFLLRRDANLQHRQAEPEWRRGVDRDGDGGRSARADIRLVGRGQHEAQPVSGRVAVHHPGQVQVDRLARVGDADRGYQAVYQQHRVVRGDVVALADEDDLGGGQQTLRSRGAQAEIEGRDADRI